MAVTPNIGLTEPVQGTTPWDAIVNGNMTIIDNCFGGIQTVPAVVATSLTGTSVKNSALTASSNGNNVSLLNAQPPTVNTTGTGAAITLYTYTLPANTLRTGTGLRISYSSNHTGTASTTYTITFGAQTIITHSNTASGYGSSTLLFFNSGATNSQKGATFGPVGNFSNSGSNLVNTVDTTVAQTITFTFSVANTDQVQGLLFMVELIQ